jgi:WD40 repeat protein
LEGHTSDVEAVVFSPNGQILASGGGTPDNDILLWDSATGTLRHTLSGHRAGVHGLAFSPDGMILASIGWDATLRLWDVANGQQLRALESHTSSVWSAAIHPDGDWLASGGDDGLVHIWGAAGEKIATFNAATNRVTALAINPVGSEIALAADQPEASIQIWDTELGLQLYNLSGHTTFAQVAAYSPDGRWLATGGSLGDNSVIVWDTLSREIAYQFPDQTRSVKSLVFGPDDILITGDGRGTIRMWDLNNGEPIQTLEGHTCAVNALAVNPTGEILASGGCDKSVIFWNLPNGETLSRTDGFAAPITHLSFDAAGNQLIASDDEGQLWQLNSDTGDSTSLGQFDQPEIQFIQPNPNGGFWFANGSASGVLDVWQIQQE